jgi:hypothetical protein
MVSFAQVETKQFTGSPYKVQPTANQPEGGTFTAAEHLAEAQPVAHKPTLPAWARDALTLPEPSGTMIMHGRLAQLVRAPALQAGGRRFEPCTAHHP